MRIVACLIMAGTLAAQTVDDLEKKFNEARFYEVICQAQEMLARKDMPLGETIVATEFLAMAASAHRDYEQAELALASLLKIMPGYVYPTRMMNDAFLFHLFRRLQREKPRQKKSHFSNNWLRF